ncbi:MAG: hypothetical protein HY360_05405 [Verrucomicrobia bacterium]|nr:hypothetical protein [Verrucomicrobiota bacterium]
MNKTIRYGIIGCGEIGEITCRDMVDDFSLSLLKRLPPPVDAGEVANVQQICDWLYNGRGSHFPSASETNAATPAA